MISAFFLKVLYKLNIFTYFLQDLYQAMLDGDIDITQIPLEEDPFWEPVEETLIGTASIFLQSLSYVLDFEDRLTVTSYKGQEEGFLTVSISPCKSNGRILGEECYVENPRELLGVAYHFKVHFENSSAICMNQENWISTLT